MTAPIPTIERPTEDASQSRERRWWLVIAAVAAVALVAIAAIILTGGEEPTDDPTLAPPAVEEPGDGTDGAPQVRYEEEPPANWDVTGVESDDVLNVRTGPGVGFPVTATLAPDTVELESTGRIARVDGVLWREIKVPGATSGWVNARYLVDHQPSAALPDIGVGLPAPAMTTAREIFTLSQRGDLDSLAVLALVGETEFTASFGDTVTTPVQLVALWERIGRDEVLRWMTALVQLPDWYETEATDAAGTRVAIHVTPRFMHEPTAANRQLLEERVGAAVESSIADGQWLGWRLGITADGDWQFFVSGD